MPKLNAAHRGIPSIFGERERLIKERDRLMDRTFDRSDRLRRGRVSALEDEPVIFLPIDRMRFFVLLRVIFPPIILCAIFLQ